MQAWRSGDGVDGVPRQSTYTDQALYMYATVVLSS